MDEQRLRRVRVWATGLVTLLIWGLLAWEHLHGGVPSHSLLARDDMPAISNAWGGVLLPVLTWLLLGRIGRRLLREPQADASTRALRAGTGFLGALLFGVLLSVFFTTGHEQVTSRMVVALIPLALLFPIYRAEYVLGFVLGMTCTFGAVLPLGFAGVVVLMAAVVHLGPRAIARRLVGRQRRRQAGAAEAGTSMR